MARDRAVIAKLPDFFRPHEGKDIPEGIVGATVLAFGTTDERVEGGGLVIDYRPATGEPRRLVLAFTETGMWVHRASILDTDQR